MAPSALPPFQDVRIFASALAVAFRAAGIEDVWSVDDDGLHRDDGGGNTAHVVPLPGGRGVVLGYDHEYSETVLADPPVDLLEDGPAWLPWDLLVPHQEADELGFCRWWDGAAWTDRNAERDRVQDGLGTVLQELLGPDAAADGLVAVATAWRGVRPEAGVAEHVAAAATRLLDAARAGDVRAEHVDALFVAAPVTGPDRDGAIGVAGACGVAGGVPAPAREPRPVPVSRRVRRRSPAAHDALLRDAMTSEPERPRPLRTGPHPVPGRVGRLLGRDPWSPAERALLDHVRSRRAPGADRGVLLALVTDAWSTTRADAEHPLAAADGGAFADGRAAAALREADRDPDHGAWFFVRADVGPHGEQLERVHDGIPAWWPAGPGGGGPYRDDLRRELGRRDAAWRPSWAALADGDGLVFEDVPVPREG